MNTENNDGENAPVNGQVEIRDLGLKHSPFKDGDAFAVNNHSKTPLFYVPLNESMNERIQQARVQLREDVEQANARVYAQGNDDRVEREYQTYWNRFINVFDAHGNTALYR